MGLIPLIGGIVGLILILLGIFRYKNRKLVIIGIAGVLFTVGVYSSLIYYFKYSKQFRKNYAQFSQPFMNTLIKDIEFYKIQHGTYPDSLEQITANDKMVIIYDPMQNKNPLNNKSRFYYKKNGLKYWLFSSGIDGVPYTQDDIFPSLIFFDSTKTGLIRAFQ